MEAGSWYEDAVAWATDNEIVLGMGDGSFGTDEPVTREQIAVFLYRYAKYVGLDVSEGGSLAQYSDASEVSDWAQDAMGWAVYVGLFKGNELDELNPDDSATRAEVAALLERLVKLIVK